MSRDDDYQLILLKAKYRRLFDEYRRIKARKEAAEKAGRAVQRFRRATYIARHPVPGFNGFFCGMDFSNGLGSTSNAEDFYRVIEEMGCTDAQEEASNSVELGPGGSK
jgi:hypothetical protein